MRIPTIRQKVQVQYGLIQENNWQRKNQLLYEERCLERHMEYVNELHRK